MSASDHTQKKQFWTAGELMGIKITDGAGSGSMTYNQDKATRDIKIETAQKNGWTGQDRSTDNSTLYDSIKEKGVQQPVRIGRNAAGEPVLRDGHHRVAVANDIDPNMVVPHEYL